MNLTTHMEQTAESVNSWRNPAHTKKNSTRTTTAISLPTAHNGRRCTSPRGQGQPISHDTAHSVSTQGTPQDQVLRVKQEEAQVHLPEQNLPDTFMDLNRPHQGEHTVTERTPRGAPNDDQPQASPTSPEQLQL